jgi:hypothetical protein
MTVLKRFSFISNRKFSWIAILSILVFSFQAYDFLWGGKSSLAIHYERPFLDSKALSSGVTINEAVHRNSGESWIDVGGSAFQTNPIAYVVENSGSFFWTDLIASGNGIAEDFTFQPFSIVNIFSTIFHPRLLYNHLSFLLLLFSSLFCFSYYLLSRYGLEIFPSVIGGAFFVFNGFVTSGWSNSVVLPYLFCPILLLPLSMYVEGKIKFVIPVIVCVFFLLNTFLPVLILSIIGMFLLICGEQSSSFSFKSYLNITKRFLLILLISFLVASFVYIPSFNQFYLSGSFAGYNSNSNSFHIPLEAILLFFGPMHQWKNFNSLYIDNFHLWEFGGFSVPYFGVVGIFLLFHSIFFNHRSKYILWGVLVVALLSLFTQLSYFVKYIPVMRSISYGYFFSLVVLVSSVLVAFGVQSLSSNRSIAKVTLVALLMILLEAVYLKLAPVNTLSSGLIISYVILACTLIMPFIFTESGKRSFFFLIVVNLELFLLQNHNKVDFVDFKDIKQRSAIEKLIADPDLADYRILNTGFNILPPNISAALGISEVSTMGHLSLDANYNSLYKRGIGSDNKLYSIHGFTDCKNLRFNQVFLDEMSIKYVLTDRANCSTHFAGKLPILYEDDAIVIFNNPTAVKVVNFKPYTPVSHGRCEINLQKRQFSRLYEYKNCHGVLDLHINFKRDFTFTQNGLVITPENLQPFGKRFFLAGNGVVKINYSPLYFISTFTSIVFIVTILIMIINRRKASD